MDAIAFKVRENSKVVNKAVYLAVGLRNDGLKEVLGMWLGKNESASFWMSVLTDLKVRGVQDILITVTDNLNGFTNTINDVFPGSGTQICVIHQIRNATKYVVWKEKKEFTRDMKSIYTAPNRDAAKQALDDFKIKWNSKYSYAVDSWYRNWDELTVFLDFPVEIRKVIYTTIWRFKESLIKNDLMDKLFNLILSSIENKGLLLKKGTCVDATIIQSSTKPLSKERRNQLKEKPSSQIDTDADSTAKRGKKYFGYKGHIGTDIDSKIIRKRSFTSARPHDSKEKENLLSGDEKAVFGDSAYSNRVDKQKARKEGVHYGMLDKATRSKKLTVSQKKRNKKKSKIRNQVEYPFGYIKEKLKYQKGGSQNTFTKCVTL